MRILILSAALVIAIGFLMGCRTSFTGDGVLTDKGFWSYPRYTIVFESFDITRSAHQTFTFKGVPSARLTFGLVVTNVARKADPASVVRGSHYENAILHIEIRKDDGTVIAEARAPISQWQLSRSPERLMLWHEQLRDVRFVRRFTYSISVGLSDVGRSAQPFLLRPVLEGGGNELP